MKELKCFLGFEKRLRDIFMSTLSPINFGNHSVPKAIEKSRWSGDHIALISQSSKEGKTFTEIFARIEELNPSRSAYSIARKVREIIPLEKKEFPSLWDVETQEDILTCLKQRDSHDQIFKKVLLKNPERSPSSIDGIIRGLNRQLLNSQTSTSSEKTRAKSYRWSEEEKIEINNDLKYGVSRNELIIKIHSKHPELSYDAIDSAIRRERRKLDTGPMNIPFNKEIFIKIKEKHPNLLDADIKDLLIKIEKEYPEFSDDVLMEKIKDEGLEAIMQEIEYKSLFDFLKKNASASFEEVRKRCLNLKKNLEKYNNDNFS